MRSSKLSVPALLAGLLTVAVATWALAATNPKATDTPFKTWLFTAGMLGQWFVSGGLTGLIAGRQGLLHGLLLAIVGCPLVSALWLGLLFGWPMFSAAHYWPIFRDFIVFALPLAVLGAVLGGLVGRRQEKDSWTRPFTITLS